MRAPAVPIVAAFAAGIALGSSAGWLPAVWVALVVTLLLAALGALRREAPRSSWVLGLSAWLFLGALAASLERAERPRNNVATLMSSGRLDAREALRWSGRLRADPVRLPGGIRYDVDLDQVQTAANVIAVSGGLRANLFTNPHNPELPVVLRAGDRAEFFVRARVPRNYQDPGTFDFRAYYERQQIHLLGTLRAAALVQKLDGPPPALRHRLARFRGRLLDQLDSLFAQAPAEAAILRAMLLGDRGFIDQDLAVDFQKTAVYHVLVIAGLHVAALAWFVFWLARLLRLRLEWRIALTLMVLVAFVAVVEDRPPIVRAAMMATVALAAMALYRRVEPLNTVGVAALAILAFRPSALTDPSFQLSFLAVGTIGALGAPWIERSSEPYRRALTHLGDVTRDPDHAPRAAQFRLDARAVARWLEARLPQRFASRAPLGVTIPCRVALRLWEICLISFVLQIGMLPLLTSNFHRVSLSGTLANVPAVLLIGLIVPLGFLTLGASLLWYSLAAALAALLGWLVALLAGTVRWFARWPRLSYRIPGPPHWLLVAFFTVLILLGIVAHVRRRNAEPPGSVAPASPTPGERWAEWTLALTLSVLAICVATFPFAPGLERGRLEATVLDVGQGDAIFVAFPDGRTMLVDGGGLPAFSQSRGVGYERSFNIGEQVVSPYLWGRGLKRIDVVALSHAHQDHLGGLRAVLENFKVGELWVGRDVPSPAFHSLLEEAPARGTAIVHHHRGDSFSWDAVNGRVLWPEDALPTEQGSNNDSLVLRLEDQGVVFLLPGDIEHQVEEELVARGDRLHADFLKIPHHGSRTSSTADFLAAVAPQVEVISAGENNPYGHPNAEALARLAGHGARLLRTDRDGAVTVTTDGHALQVHSFVGDLAP
jgi:competence protein ComEC